MRIETSRLLECEPQIRYIYQIPIMTWGQYRHNKESRYKAFLNWHAMEQVYDIMGVDNTDEIIGVQVYIGTGEDEGKFALGFVPFDENDPPRNVSRLNRRGMPGGKGRGQFTCGHLAIIKERGRTRLVRQDDYLVGDIEEIPAMMPKHWRDRGNHVKHNRSSLK